MSYAYTEDQLGFRDLLADFMRKEVEPYKAQWDEEGFFPKDTYKKAFEIGLHMMEIPEKWGGAGLDHETMALIYEEAGYWDAGFGMTMLTTTVQPLKATLMFGTDEQIQMVSDVAVNGGFGCWALTEPNSGSDASSLETTYRREGDEFVLNGSKCFATLGAYADMMVVFATKDRKLGKDGVSAFIVPGHLPGIIVGKSENKMGMRLSNTASVTFDEVRIPAANMLGEEGKGMRIALATLNLGRFEIASLANGITRRALEEAVKYAKVRKVFGKPIIDHQMVTAILADMATTLEAGRALVREGMAAFEEKDPNVRIMASAAKLFCCDGCVKASQDAIQVLGGYGYSKEYPVEKLYRDSKILQILEGTQQIQKIVIGRELNKKY
ncbi:MAG: acyl-CoA dehydrogenase family protein [Firmicutes bacterium]|nr:acyl-CoA dehydrogenase family protein [Bacillota bacterium]